MKGRIFVSGAAVLMIALLLVPYSNSAPAGKKLIVAVGQEPTSLDPSLCFTGGDYMVTDNWGEALIYKTTSGDLKPGLVTSWKMSADGKEIEFALRKGVKFHSGDALTSKDVEFSFERGRTKNSSTRTRLRSVDKFEIIDDYRFKIHFKTPDVTFMPNRAGGAAIVSKSYYDRVGEDKFVKQPVATGPYKITHYVPGEYVDLERFEDYWGEKPPVKEARFYFVPEDTTRLAKLKAGEVDLISNCPYPAVKDLEQTPGLKLVRLETNHTTQAIMFSVKNPKTPWHDRRVRLAMAYAIDCNSIIKNVLFGIPNHWAFLAPHELGYDPNLKPYPYDPKKARELLAEAGYPKGFDLKLYWLTTGMVPMMRETVEAIASYFEAVGIRTKLMGEEYAAGQARYRAARSPEAEYVGFFTAAWAAGSEPSYNLNLYFSADGGFSIYYNPDVEKAVTEATTILDDSKRGEAIKKAIKMIYEDVGGIPIFNNVVVYAMKGNIDFKPTLKHNMGLVLVKDVTIR